MTTTDKLRAIRNQVLNLTNSPLYQYRTENNYHPVLGQGSHQAKVIFIGEAPGKNEAETGVPFCGASGKILDQLLDSIKLNRQDVYITNIVKDRPPKNRDPKPEEIDLYAPFLIDQINIIKPKVLATLGRFSMDFIMRKFGLEDKLQAISKLRGQVFPAKADFGPLKIIPLYHPAVAIYNRTQLPTLESDFKVILKSI